MAVPPVRAVAVAAHSTDPHLSVIVPACNEAAGIATALAPLQPWRERGTEVLVVDGGSTDATQEIAAPWADRVLSSPAGRARQMNAGAAQARGRILLFLHADTELPRDGDRELVAGLDRTGRRWGRFDVRLSGAKRYPLLRLVQASMNRRSRWTGIATGDQAIFVERALFEAQEGFPNLPLMEDIALSTALKRAAGRPLCLARPALTSSRRWEEHGIAATIVRMWALRLAYFCGAPPELLARLYR